MYLAVIVRYIKLGFLAMPLPEMNTLKITDYLAIYAAGLSSIVFFWNVVQSRPRIKVDLIFGIEGEGKNLLSGAYIFVRNLSSHDVHLSHIGILCQLSKPTLKQRIAHLWRFKSSTKRMGWSHSSLSNYSIESGCPVCLEARKSHKVFIPEAKVEEMLSDATGRSLMAYVQDQLWNNIYSGEFKCPSPKAA